MPVDVDITGASGLWLVVTDGGNGYECDWADWIEPKLIRADGTALMLTELDWKSASAGWGEVQKNKNCAGGGLRVDRRSFANGIGTHAPSIIHFELRGSFTRFQSRAGPDMAGVEQGCGTQVEFLVFAEPPPDDVLATASTDSLPIDFGPEAARRAIEDMTVADGLEVTLFASEPMLRNPTNIDIDHRGRVWVAEGVNYRYSIKPWGVLEPKGDRIVILEDTDGDGKADLEKVFYQDPSLRSPLGLCVLGNQVIVSCSPEVFLLTDVDGDDRADRKEVLFSGIGAVDHDHGVHAVVFGPDGNLYFNMGNDSGQLKTPEGGPVVDVLGREVSQKTGYRQGMAFRCHWRGTPFFEVLGHNFRNPYELCVDSFGTVWQSDNDDDGNRSTRINYVMQRGNFGYTDERTGASWHQKRTNLEADTPGRHWHQNDPGVVPNLLVTGAGSPTGIIVYEGALLPEAFRDGLIHCDAGPRVVRCYTTQADGAGYQAQLTELVSSSDSWFRPSDVCVAPDGSLFVADWNDAGVGGHNMADRNPAMMKGRIYRIAPKGVPLRIPEYDFTTVAGAARALQSPNQAARYLAWMKLHEAGKLAEPELLAIWKRHSNPRIRARALHLLARIPGRAKTHITRACRDKNPDLRIAGLRIARDLDVDFLAMAKKLARDPSAQVRRECALLLNGHSGTEMPKIWAELASAHQAGDRWYLEALGIGAAGRESECVRAWLNRAGDRWNTPAGREILWRSRAPESASRLAQIISDPATPQQDRLRCFRALDFFEGPEKQQALLQLLRAVQ